MFSGHEVASAHKSGKAISIFIAKPMVIQIDFVVFAQINCIGRKIEIICTYILKYPNIGAVWRIQHWGAEEKKER